MQREVKFRVFCRVHEKWEYYTLGDLICGGALSSNGEGSFSGETWGQYVGIEDVNGNPIFEGDILDAHSDGYGLVVWNKDQCGWDYQFSDGETVGLWEIVSFKMKPVIIGNIIQHKELMSEQ